MQIQQGDRTTVIEQDPGSSRPVLKVHDGNGMHVASKYKPLDTPGIEVSKGGQGNTNTIINVGDGSSQQTIEMLRQPSNSSTTSASALKTTAELAAEHSSQARANSNQAQGLGVASIMKSPGAAKSSFHGGGNTLDSATSGDNSEKASADQKQAMEATDRQQSSSASELFSSSSHEQDAKDPAKSHADTALGKAAATAVDIARSGVNGIKSAVTGNDTEVTYLAPSICLRCCLATAALQA